VLPGGRAADDPGRARRQHRQGRPPGRSRQSGPGSRRWIPRPPPTWLAALSIPIYVFLFILATTLLAPLGMIGGMLVGLVAAACFGGYLSLLSSAVEGSQIRFADLKHGLRAVWDVVSVFFALWIVGLGVGKWINNLGAIGTFIAASVLVPDVTTPTNIRRTSAATLSSITRRSTRGS